MKKFFVIAVLFIASCGGGGENEEQPASGSDVLINEIFVKSSSDEPDWIELYNKGSESVDISGWTIQDEKDRDPYTIPSGTTLASKAFLVIERDEDGKTGFSFGLGSKDAARLFNTEGTRMDKIEWKSDTIPEDKSYGRVPDGSDTIQLTTEPTPGSENK